MKIHIVQKGDTLWKLAKQYGVDFEALKAANTQLSNPDMIMPGMKIKIPTGSVPVKKEAQIQGKQVKEKPIYKKEMPIQPSPPVKEMPKYEMPQLPQPTMPQPQPMPQQPSYDIHQNMYNVHLYKPQQIAQPMPTVSPPPMKKKEEKPPKKEMHKPIKEQPVYPPQQPEMPAPMPMPAPQPSPPPIQQPVYQGPPMYYQPDCFYPISPVMPGCANCGGSMYPQPFNPMMQMAYPMQQPYHQPPMSPMMAPQQPMPLQMMPQEQFDVQGYSGQMSLSPSPQQPIHMQTPGYYNPNDCDD